MREETEIDPVSTFVVQDAVSKSPTLQFLLDISDIRLYVCDSDAFGRKRSSQSRESDFRRFDYLHWSVYDESLYARR